jgi:uncharacterized membrane protein YkoI
MFVDAINRRTKAMRKSTVALAGFLLPIAFVPVASARSGPAQLAPRTFASAKVSLGAAMASVQDKSGGAVVSAQLITTRKRAVYELQARNDAGETVSYIVDGVSGTVRVADS